MKRVALIAVLIVFTLLAWAARAPGAPQHEVFLGQILLRDGSIVEAVYVQDGRIAAIGSRETVFETVPWGTRRVRLGEGVLTAGLIEPHTHPLATAILSAAVDLSGATHSDRASMMAAMERAVRRSGPSPWVIGFGWDPAMIEGLEPPSIEELDALSPDRPLVILTQMMHEAFVNTAALEAAGLSSASPDPEGGVFERDATGALTGRVIEVPAIRALMAAAPDAPDAAIAHVLNETLNTYARAGYTTIGVAALVGRSRDPLALFTEAAGRPDPVLNSVLYVHPESLERARQLWSGADAPDAIRRLGGVKFWMDGSPFVGGAALLEPYARSSFTESVLALPEGWHGELLVSPEEASRHVQDAARWGYDTAIHAQGEIAIDAALDALQSAPEGRHRLEHLALITPEQAARAAEMDVSLGFFIDHITFYGHMLSDLVGEDRTARYMPVGMAARSGAVTTLHSDNPATPIDALRVLAAASERRTRLGGDVIGPDLAVSRLEALDMMTLQAARQLRIEDETGSIEIGKRADFTWFSENPLTAEDLTNLEVRGTWISGHRADTRAWSLRRLRLFAAAAWAVMLG